jgi:hypothetical protein
MLSFFNKRIAPIRTLSPAGMGFLAFVGVMLIGALLLISSSAGQKGKPDRSAKQKVEQEQPVWNAKISYTAKFSFYGAVRGYQEQTFVAEYQIDKSGQPVSGSVRFSDLGRVEKDCIQGGKITSEPSEWSVADTLTFNSYEELAPGKKAGLERTVGIEGIGLPWMPSPQIFDNRRFILGESGIEVGLGAFYPNAMTGPCDGNCRKTCRHDLEVDLMSGSPRHGYEVVEGSPPAGPPEISLEQEAQEEAQWEARAKAWLEKLRKGKEEEVQREAEKWAIAVMPLAGMIELKGNVYQGSRQWTERAIAETKSTITHNLTWSFSLIPEDVEAVMIPEEEYEEWLPEGRRDGREDEAGLTPLRVKVKLHPKGKPKEEVSRKATFRFELVDVSNEPGVCINWPHQDNAELKGTPDLAIEDIYNPKLTVEATWQTKRGKAGPKAETKTTDTEAEVIISSFDYGAYGTLKIYAELEGGGTAVAYLKDRPSVKELKLPKDENNNHIADKWERDKGVMGAKEDSDEDMIPRGDGTKGDGLSVFEEYRGTMALDDQGIEKHVRTHPKKKTLFINYTDMPDAKPGVELFQNATGLEIISIDEKQYGNNTHRLININSKTGRSEIPQHGLYLKSTQLDQYTGGRSPIGPPKFVDKVEIGIGSEHPDTIAHELGHAVGMPHHGNKNYWCVMVREGGRHCKDNVRYNRVPENYTGPTLSSVAVWQGQNSGGEECIMRYGTAGFIEKIERGRTLYFVYDFPDGKPDKDRTRFCRNDKGTGVNDSNRKPWPKAGNATPGCGNNLGYIRISDKYDSPRPGHVQRGCL